MNIQNHTIARKPVVSVQQHCPKQICHIDRVESHLRALGRVPWWHRDPLRKAGPSEWSWIKIFQRDHFCCVFCGTNLAESSRALAQRTTDHLIPKLLFPSDQEANRGCNLVTACADCNALKADWRPTTVSDLAWRSRAAFIRAARCHIEKMAWARHDKDQPVLEMAQDGAPLEEWSDERQADIESDRLDYLASPFAKIAGIDLRSSTGRPRE